LILSSSRFRSNNTSLLSEINHNSFRVLPTIKNFQHKLLTNAFFQLHVGRVVGITLVIFTLFRYRSYENRPVLGLWSYPFFTLIIGATILLVVLVGLSWQARRRPSLRSDITRAPLAFIDVAVLFWGVAKLCASIDDSANAGQVSDLVFFGSLMPAASLVEWISLVLLFGAACSFAVRTIKGRWINISLASGVIVLSMLILEGVARVKVALEPGPQGFPTYSSQLWSKRFVHLNREGFRDVEHDISQESHENCILIVGDSFAFGWGIKRIDERFGEQLIAKLGKSTGKDWASINAGRPDSHTLEHISILKRMLVHRPSIVILLYVFNDIDYLYPVTHRDEPAHEPQTILARLHPLRLFYQNSYLLQEVYVRLRLIYYRFLSNSELDSYADSALVHTHLRDLTCFVSTASRTGAVVGVVPFDATVGVDPVTRRRYENFVTQAVAFGIPVWSLLHAFDGRRLSELTVNALDGHPNELANQLAASEIAERLLRELRNEEKH
jgi:hypothetical protein